MKLMISQPTFCPWLGYFDMIDQSDLYVILNDVDFAYQSWQHRNNFITDKGLETFTVSISKGKKKQLISEVEIADKNFFIKKFSKFLFFNYKKTKFFDNYYPKIVNIISKKANSNLLIDLNIQIITSLIQILKIKVDIKRSSELKINEKKTQKVFEICSKLNAKEYLSALGSQNYLEKDKKIFLKKKIKIIYHKYNHPTYLQNSKKFIKFASILDLIFNEGDSSLDIIRSGRKN